jgi:hypothetical protein
VHAVRGHPHAVEGVVTRTEIPAVPECAVAYVDAWGNLKTTISRSPVAAGERVAVRVGDVEATALVGDDRASFRQAELMLAPSSPSWRGADGETRRFLELTIPGASAARRFADPTTGTEVLLTPR